jgi:hypothetical protein
MDTKRRCANKTTVADGKSLEEKDKRDTDMDTDMNGERERETEFGKGLTSNRCSFGQWLMSLVKSGVGR